MEPLPGNLQLFHYLNGTKTHRNDGFWKPLYLMQCPKTCTPRSPRGKWWIWASSWLWLGGTGWAGETVAWVLADKPAGQRHQSPSQCNEVLTPPSAPFNLMKLNLYFFKMWTHWILLRFAGWESQLTKQLPRGQSNWVVVIFREGSHCQWRNCCVATSPAPPPTRSFSAANNASSQICFAQH